MESGNTWSGGDPDDVTGWTLVQAGHAMERAFTRTCARAGLTPTQFGVLMHLLVQPGTTQAALARGVLLTPQSVGEQLRVLEGAGYVERTGPAGRGRPISVALTDAGRAVLGRLTPHVVAMNRPAALGLTDEEARTLNHLLHRVRSAVSG